MENKPLVSVLITAYNREKLIAEALESVLECTYRNIEIIIVDDVSTDNTLNVIKEFAEKDSRICYYQNKKNLGDYPNRNRAASYARGEYITYLDSDDKMLPGGLEQCMYGMLKFPGAGIGMYWAESKGESFIFSTEEAVKRHFFNNAFLVVGPGGTVLKKSFFDAIKGYPEKYGPANDMYFNLKAACYSDVVLFPFQFFFYRVHDDRESTNWYNYLYNNYLFLKDALAELPLPLSANEKEWISNKNKRRFLRNITRYLFITRNFKHLKEAIKKTDFSLKDCFKAVFHKSL
jgi:glycosyltransferase involved in cell wall biosynthesis